jgi:uncharacterized protein
MAHYLSLSEHLAPGTPKRILALDGGGTLCMIQLAFLERIEALLRERYGGDPDFRLCHYFDLMGGPSFGAIIATALAMGMSVAEVKELLLKHLPLIFKTAWLSIPGIKPRFSARAFSKLVGKIVEDEALETDKLKTGIAIVAKRLDTGSPWVLTNNPDAEYWKDPVPDPRTGLLPYIANKRYKLADLLRASTASPHYFSPQLMKIAKEDPAGLFIDGSVSANNNPSSLLLRLAGVEGYKLNWGFGKDALLMISIGAGWSRPTISPRRALSMAPANLAAEALRGAIWDAQVEALTMMQLLSSPLKPWIINREAGKVKKTVSGRCHECGFDLLSYQRYDLNFDQPQKGALVSTDELFRLNDPTNAAGAEKVYRLAAGIAASSIEIDDFPIQFNIPIAREAERQC